MALFAKNKRNQPYAFIFLCRGPGYGRSNFTVFGRNDDNLKRTVTQSGYAIPEKNIIVFSEDWNTTRYSSMELQMEGEYDDMVAKLQKKLKDEGYKFDFSKAQLMKNKFNPGTSYDMLGLWVLYVIFQ